MSSMDHREFSSMKSPVFTWRLTFNECHIVMENIMHCKEKSNFLVRLKTLQANTKDITLKQDILSLYNKIFNLNDDDYQVLRQDAENANVVFPPNYTVSNRMN